MEGQAVHGTGVTRQGAEGMRGVHAPDPRRGVVGPRRRVHGEGRHG